MHGLAAPWAHRHPAFVATVSLKGMSTGLHKNSGTGVYGGIKDAAHYRIPHMQPGCECTRTCMRHARIRLARHAPPRSAYTYRAARFGMQLLFNCIAHACAHGCTTGGAEHRHWPCVALARWAFFDSCFLALASTRVSFAPCLTACPVAALLFAAQTPGMFRASATTILRRHTANSHPKSRSQKHSHPHR